MATYGKRRMEPLINIAWEARTHGFVHSVVAQWILAHLVVIMMKDAVADSLAHLVVIINAGQHWKMKVVDAGLFALKFLLRKKS